MAAVRSVDGLPGRPLPNLRMVPISRVQPHPGNVRDGLGSPTELRELVESIQEVGILQPLVVAYDDSTRSLTLIAGHRRLAAAKVAGLKAVPVILRADIAGAEIYQAMLVENLHRANLTPLEEARAMKGLVDSGATQHDVAAWIGKSGNYVSRRLLLNDMPAELAGRLTAKEVTVSEAIRIMEQLKGRAPGDVDRGWATPWFSDEHPLAPAATERCETMRHNLRRRVGRVACGECWEAVIRLDEQSTVGGATQVVSA